MQFIKEERFSLELLDNFFSDSNRELMKGKKTNKQAKNQNNDDQTNNTTPETTDHNKPDDKRPENLGFQNRRPHEYSKSLSQTNASLILFRHPTF